MLLLQSTISITQLRKECPFVSTRDEKTTRNISTVVCKSHYWPSHSAEDKQELDRYLDRSCNQADPDLKHSIKSKGSTPCKSVSHVWVLSLSHVTMVYYAMLQLTGATVKSSEQHNETGKSRTKQDNEDCLKTLRFLKHDNTVSQAGDATVDPHAMFNRMITVAARESNIEEFFHYEKIQERMSFFKNTIIIKRDKPSLRIVNMLEEESLDDIRN